MLGIALAAVPGCRRGSGPGSRAPPVPDIAYREDAVSETTRVFLVAGGDDVANFAAEVVQQRKLWIGAGVPRDQIACYFAKPTDEGWAEDSEQYQALLSELRDCHRASPARVLGDLARVARHDPPWVYVYVTAHGVESLLELGESASSRRMRGLMLSLSATERDELDAAAIGLEAGPGPGLADVGVVIRKRRSGTALADLVLTPQTLADALTRFPGQARKVVVLQACFAGGFIGHAPDAEAPATPLAEVPNLVGLAATAADRPSFGCDSGSTFTYFGGAFNGALADALGAAPGDPTTLDWGAIFAKTAFAVGVMEAIADERPSLPGFVSTAVSPD
jgi:hypothetical protein